MHPEEENSCHPGDLTLERRSEGEEEEGLKQLPGVSASEERQRFVKHVHDNNGGSVICPIPLGLESWRSGWKEGACQPEMSEERMVDTWRDEEYVCEGTGAGGWGGVQQNATFQTGTRLVSNAVVWRLVWTRATSLLKT